jgi:hypothetical protein
MEIIHLKEPPPTSPPPLDLPPYVTIGQSKYNQGRPYLEIDQYIPHPEKEGYLKQIDNITYEDLARAVRWYLENHGQELDPDPDPEGPRPFAHRLDYYGLGLDTRQEQKKPIARHTWLAIFAVTGGCEGVYIHVEEINSQENTRRLIYLAKTFERMEFAYQVAGALADFLQA